MPVLDFLGRLELNVFIYGGGHVGNRFIPEVGLVVVYRCDAR